MLVFQIEKKIESYFVHWQECEDDSVTVLKMLDKISGNGTYIDNSTYGSLEEMVMDVCTRIILDPTKEEKALLLFDMQEGSSLIRQPTYVVVSDWPKAFTDHSWMSIVEATSQNNELDLVTPETIPFLLIQALWFCGAMATGADPKNLPETLRDFGASVNIR